uniref:Putative secreted protein n=1 Tax=Anopheles darlingi TaxID=43151 RepID=A0A2M4DPM2_ANODA
MVTKGIWKVRIIMSLSKCFTFTHSHTHRHPHKHLVLIHGGAKPIRKTSSKQRIIGAEMFSVNGEYE